MADQTSAAADVPAPPATRSTGNPTGHPRDEVVTGRNHASEFASRLMANYEVTNYANNDAHPQFTHEVSAAIIFRMFSTIILPLVYANHRPLGVATTTANNDVAALRLIADSVAYDALVSLFGVLFNKAGRINHTFVTLFGQRPFTTTRAYPFYITAIINAFGPIELTRIPFRGIHTPYFTWTSITALRPGGYNATHHTRFIEACTKSRAIALAEVNPLSLNSDPFWTFHTRETAGHHFQEAALMLYSPVEFDQVDPVLRVAVLFAGDKLTIGPGPINYSASAFYDLDDNARLDRFPQQASRYPAFIPYHPAYYTVVERYQPTDADNIPDSAQSTSGMVLSQSDSGYRPSSPNMAVDTPADIAAGSSSSGSNKRKRLPDGSAQVVTKPLHRIVYHYFDHVAVQSLDTRDQRAVWATQLNATLG